jgi:hypothetical protein
MPSFRDLKGRPVDEVVDSRTGPAPPSAPVEPVADAAELQAAARRVMERRQQQRQAAAPVVPAVLPAGHRFVGRLGVPCELCGAADQDPVHVWTHLVRTPPERGPETPAPTGNVPDLPSDPLQQFDAALRVLAEHAQQVVEDIQIVRAQALAVRATATQQLAKLAKLQAALQSLTD